MRGLLKLATGIALLAAGGCATVPDVKLPAKGKLSGKLVLAYDNSDRRFIFLPVQNAPLTYEIGDRKIQPIKMYTDGGSIPRLFWSAKGLSPWAYGPAYAIHDYLFNQHRCRSQPGADLRDTDFSIGQANDILYDAMLIIEQNVRKDAQAGGRKLDEDEEFASERSRLLVKAAVDKFSVAAWDSKDCNKQPPDKYIVTRVTNAPDTINDKGARVTFARPRETTIRQLAPPIEILTYSFD